MLFFPQRIAPQLERVNGLLPVHKRVTRESGACAAGRWIFCPGRCLAGRASCAHAFTRLYGLNSNIGAPFQAFLAWEAHWCWGLQLKIESADFLETSFLFALGFKLAGAGSEPVVGLIGPQCMSGLAHVCFEGPARTGFFRNSRYIRAKSATCRVAGAAALDAPDFLCQGLNGVVNLFRRVLAGYKETQSRRLFRYRRIQNRLHIYATLEHRCRYARGT